MSAAKTTKPAAETVTAGDAAVAFPELRGVETETHDGMTSIRADGYTDDQVREAWKVLRAGDPQTITGRRRIAIVGFTSHREQAPFEDDSWELWGMNNLHIYMPAGEKRPGREDKYRWDVWFQLHTASEIMNSGDQAHIDWLKQPHEFPTMMFPEAVAAIAAAGGAEPKPDEAWWEPVLPSIEPFPIEQVVARYQHEYFTNSVAWMTAFATLLLSNDHKVGLEGAELGLWGVDMAVSCLAPETRILTDDLRWVPAGDLKPGDGLIGFDRNPVEGRSRKWRKATVQRNDQVVLPCYRLLLEDGTKIVAAANHKWLTATGDWVETKDLRPVSAMVQPVSRIPKPVAPWDQEDDERPGAWYPGDKMHLSAVTPAVRVMEMEFIGDQIVMGLNTDTGTYIAEGLTSSNTEYAAQRPSCEFYLGVALGAGITVTIPATSELLYTSTPYGAREDRAYHMLATRLQQLRERREMIRRRIGELEQERQNMAIADGSHNGAIETLEHLIATQHIAPIDRNHAELFRSDLDKMTAGLRDGE